MAIWGNTAAYLSQSLMLSNNYINEGEFMPDNDFDLMFARLEAYRHACEATQEYADLKDSLVVIRGQPKYQGCICKTVFGQYEYWVYCTVEVNPGETHAGTGCVAFDSGNTSYYTSMVQDGTTGLYVAHYPAGAQKLIKATITSYFYTNTGQPYTKVINPTLSCSGC